MAFFDLFIN